MGMYDATSAARAEVVPAASYLRAGIHNVRFTGVEKGTSEYSTIDFSFEGIDEGEVGVLIFIVVFCIICEKLFGKDDH